MQFYVTLASTRDRRHASDDVIARSKEPYRILVPAWDLGWACNNLKQYFAKLYSPKFVST